MLTVIPLAIGDNYTYILRTNTYACVIDPTSAAPIETYLATHNLSLSLILNTHHHHDHTAGNNALQTQYQCRIIEAHTIHDTGTIDFNGIAIYALATPGHTRTSICYYVPEQDNVETPLLFTGDTLFIGGCGRLFECTAQDMYTSFARIATLPLGTLIYPGHEYTVDNFAFAHTIFPDDIIIEDMLTTAKRLTREGKPTVPSTLAQECSANIFMRIVLDETKSVDDFAELRKKKDLF